MTFTHKSVVNIDIVYGINVWPFTVDQDFALENSLFGAVKLTKKLVILIKINDLRWVITQNWISQVVTILGSMKNEDLETVRGRKLFMKS